MQNDYKSKNRKNERVVLLLLIFCFTFCLTAQQPLQDSRSGWTVKNPFQHKVFIQNKGQFILPASLTTTPVLYGFSDGDLSVYFTAGGLIYSYNHVEVVKHKEEELEDPEEEFSEPPPVPRQEFVSMEWEGASPLCIVEAVDSVAFYFTYGIADINGHMGSMRANAFKKIIYKNLYPGIDAVYSFTDTTGFKYALVVHPGANAALITMKYSGAELNIDDDGNLIVETAFGKIIDHAPISFTQASQLPVRSSFVAVGNRVLFVTGEYDKTETMVIDPWVYSTSFNGINAAFDVEYDLDGNVYCYGGSFPFQEIKFSKDGWIMWSFTPSLFGSPYPYYGDFAVDALTGNSYIVEGFNNGKIIKLNPYGNLLAFYQGNSLFREMWRCTYNNCTKNLIIGGSSWSLTYSYQIARIDTNLQTLVPVNIISAPDVEGTHDVCLLAIDNDADCYMLVAESALYPNSFDNVLVKADAATMYPTDYIVNSGHSFPESGYLSAYGGEVMAGINGMSVNKKYLYTYDGSTIQRRKKSTGALLNSATLGPQPYKWAGLAVDDCGGVYVAVDNMIMMCDSAFNVLSSIAAPNTVYDVRLGSDNMLYASGKNFVAAYKLLIPPCSPFKLYFKYEPCTSVTSVTVTVEGGTPPYSFYWNGLGDTTNYLHDVKDGHYFLTITDASCVPRRLEYPVPVTKLEKPFLEVSYEDTLCAGEPLIMKASGGIEYEWSTGATTTMVTEYPAFSTTYSVVSTSEKGCVDSLKMDIIVYPAPEAGIDGADTICAGEPIHLVGHGGFFYEWNTGETNDTLLIKPATTTIYFLIASNEACGDTATAEVVVREQKAGADVITTDGYHSQLVAYGGIAYQWFPSDGLSCDSCALTDAKSDSASVYCVAVTDSNGCADTACVSVSFTAVYVPNAFTPNNNNLNEVFKPVIQHVHDYHFVIYNRWGEKIFETNSTAEGWNGYQEGKKCQEDVYIYRLKFRDNEKKEEHVYYGKVVLIR